MTINRKPDGRSSTYAGTPDAIAAEIVVEPNTVFTADLNSRTSSRTAPAERKPREVVYSLRIRKELTSTYRPAQTTNADRHYVQHSYYVAIGNLADRL